MHVIRSDRIIFAIQKHVPDIRTAKTFISSNNMHSDVSKTKDNGSSELSSSLIAFSSESIINQNINVLTTYR